MATCTEENVSTVQTKRLKENIDIKEVKCVKCSPGNSFLLVQRLDFALNLVYVKTGRVNLVCKEVKEFMWSTPAKHTSPKRNVTFSILRNNGNVEVYEIKGESLNAKESSPEESNNKEKSVILIGSLTATTMKTLLGVKTEGEIVDFGDQEEKLKCSRLVNSKHGLPNEEDRLDYVTLLTSGYLIVVLSFSVLQSPEVLKCFEMLKHIPAVPFLLPQETITDIKASEEMLFILYEHGIVVVYDLKNWIFHGWIDVFVKTDAAPDADVCASQRRPSTMILDVDKDEPMLFICDDSNNVIKINLEAYYKHFPSHLQSHDDAASHLKTQGKQGPTSAARDHMAAMTLHDVGMGENLFGDTLWRTEVLSISRQMEYTSKTDVKSKSNIRNESDEGLKTLEEDDFSDDSQSVWSVVILPPLWMEDFTISGLYCSSGSFLLWLKPKGKTNNSDLLELNHGVLCCYLDSKEEYLINLFMEETVVASGGQPTRPFYLLTSTKIGLPVFGTSQNELVNKIIMYENVAMAEKLCHINNWDHFAVPISALEAALKHEQLDTVAFYLKTKGRAFTTIAAESEAVASPKTFSPLSPTSFNTRQLYSKSTQSEDVLGQITSVVNLLVNTIKTSSRRKHSVQFTSQLLQMSFDYVNGLMQDAVNYVERELGNQCDREKIHDILSFLTTKTMELRWFLYGIPPFTPTTTSSELADKIEEEEEEEEEVLPIGMSSETQQIILKKWESLDDKDVLQDAILSCQIPLAQVYFLKQGQSFLGHDGSLRSIIQSGFNLVLEMLSGKNIETAIAMLKNMGEDVVHLIRSICLKTFDRPLRDYLIEQLNSWGELREEEINSVKFLVLLEAIYNNQSFESCQIQKSQRNGDPFSDLGLLQKPFDVTETSAKSNSLKTGSIAPQYHASMVSGVSGGYCEILLDWVIGWDQETRERILFEKLIYDVKAMEVSTMVSEKSCWQYLKAHSETKRIIDWISSTAKSSLNDSQVLPPLTSEAYSDLSDCSLFLREVVLDELTRNGLYSKKLLTNFSLLLRHLCRTRKLFTKGHPLDEIARSDGKKLATNLQEQETVYSAKLFHEEMIEHCSRHDFMNLLYFYLDFYRLGQTTEEAEELVPKNVDPQVHMLLKFRLAGLSPSDPSIICASSFSNSSVVLSTSNPSLINMLSNHRPIMAVATCLYAPVDLMQILRPNSGSANNDIWQVDETLLKSTLSCYPRLYSALYPRSGNEKLAENPDITLYELLQGNCSFEVSNLFAWQPTNTLVKRRGESSEMPHFSQKVLVDKFAHKETLTYVYFLKHGRPSFAYITYLSKYQHRKFIPKASISKATWKVYRLAIAHFGNNRIAYSCVSFLELLGVDTTFLRIDIEAARRILHHGNKEELQCTTTDEFKNVVMSELLKRTRQKQRKPKSLVPILEASTRNLISKEGLERTSREASQFWSLPIMFCRSHNMTLTPAFLIDCAKADKWLAFICHAQSAQFPKNQVLGVVQHCFENNNLKEHLHQTLANVVTINMKAPGSVKRKGKSIPPRRDVRSQYLSRVIGASPVGKSEPTVIPRQKDEVTDVPLEINELRRETELEMKRELVEEEGEEDEDDSETEIKTTNKTMAASVTDLNPETSPDNLFDVLSLCNETKHPWQAIVAHSIALKRPLFAVLAACYEDANFVDCMSAWLCSQHDYKEKLHPVLMNISDVQWHRWTLEDLLSLILTISKLGANFSHILAKAFYLFDPNNFLLPLMRFYEAFSIHVDFVAAGNQLSEFVLQHKSLSVNEDQRRPMIIGDLVWCENVSNGVVQNMLRSCQTMYMQVHLLRLLCHCKYGNGFSIKIPDFNKLYKISQVLEEGSVFAQCVDLKGNETEIERILEELLHHQKFTLAREYAILLDQPRDKVSLQQIILKKENMQASRLWEIEGERIEFWESCDRYLEEQECATAGIFFEEQSKASSVSPREKATLLCLALNSFSARPPCGKAMLKSQDDLVELEREMWLGIINDRAKSLNEDQVKTPFYKFTCCEIDFDLLQERFLAIEGNPAHCISDEKMQLVLKDIIRDLLDEGRVTQARRLSVLFGISTTDLDIVLSCIFLAEEIQFPASLEEKMKTLLSSRERKTSFGSLKSSGCFIESLSQSEKSIDDCPSESDDGLSVWSMVGSTLARMEDLASSCQSGKICCARVIVAYKICQTLGLEFDKVVSTDSFELLCSLLGSSFDQRYQLATQYIKSFNLDSRKIAQFVAKSISTSLSIYAGAEVQEDNVLIFNPASREDMNNVVNLTEDKLMLGGLLFEEALLLAKRRKKVKPSSSALTMEVELLISAHHCQTLACNTEGISSILKLAQLCTRALAEANKYQLMVRLLTGIGRFGEMTYIFQTLMEHHHFELLIKKNVDNEKKLKIALLNYLDKYHLEDTEKRSLVAYCFNMHREVAISLKTSADSQVHKLVKRGLSANSEVRSQLVSIAQTYTYAMENFKKEGCLLQALECAKKHRLVELQNQRLPTGMVILDLNNKSLSEFFAEYNNFFECYIVADAYNKRSLDIWVEPLFKHVILKGDFNYFKDICSVFPISKPILSEVVSKYRTELQRNTYAMANMKIVLRHDKDILSRYKLALELGYHDEVESIIKSEAGALVRDTSSLS